MSISNKAINDKFGYKNAEVFLNTFRSNGIERISRSSGDCNDYILYFLDGIFYVFNSQWDSITLVYYGESLSKSMSFMGFK